MTFDLLGLAPGPGLDIPDVAHRFNCDSVDDLEETEAIALVPGPHLADGAASLPIVRAMLDLACGLARNLPDVRTICWSPARSATAMPMFCKNVENWLEGGPFPALGLTGFAPGEGGTLASEGLSHFLGQELAIAPDLAEDRIAATRLGARLVHDLVGSGRVEEPRELTMADGLNVRLAPKSRATIVEVTRM